MKILFFCGSLEPGRDGVGDYTHRLAAECATRGHGCTVVALHDPADHVSDVTVAGVRLIRLPAHEPWAARLARAQQHLEKFAPDWVSWQLVAQGFHPRGFLPSALLQAAGNLRGGRCHVMLHELWLGLEAGASWHHRTVGWLQRRGILYFLNQLEPDAVTTSNAAYAQALAREGFPAAVLELFGNVPVAGGLDRQALLTRWLPGSEARPLIAVTFGTLHPQWQPVPTAEWLQAIARRRGRTPSLLAVGRTGLHAAAIADVFSERRIRVWVTGELEETIVSHLLQAADFGIAPHPWALIGKSGAAAAMLDHGLPVLVPRDDWQLRGISVPGTPEVSAPRLIRLAGLAGARTDRWLATRSAPDPALPRITAAFLAMLETAGAIP